MRELMHLHLGWAEKRRYEGKVVAEGAEPSRVVLHLSGPGVVGSLAGEKGLRQHIEEQARVGAYVRLHRMPNGSSEPKAGLKIEARDVKRRTGDCSEKVASEAKARDEQSGRSLQLSGAGDARELGKLRAGGARGRRRGAAVLHGPRRA